MGTKKLNYGQLAKYVVLAQQGDETAFATLYAATIDSQLTFATAFLKDLRLAEDAVQEAYIALYQSMEKIKNPKTLVAYLNRITFNTCLNIKKKAQRFNEQVLLTQPEHIPEGAVQNVFSLPSEYRNPAEYYDDIELKNELSLAFDQLPDIQKAVVLMHYYQNMTAREIALALYCSERTVKRYLAAAKSILRRCLLSGNL